jgi:hypothetical protein
MERNEIERRDDIRGSEIGRKESNRAMMAYEDGGSAAGLAWKLVGGTAVAVLAAAVLFSLPDIKRYIKMSRM